MISYNVSCALILRCSTLLISEIRISYNQCVPLMSFSLMQKCCRINDVVLKQMCLRVVVLELVFCLAFQI